MLDVYKEMVRYVGDRLQRPTSLQVGSHSYDVFARGDADFGFI